MLSLPPPSVPPSFQVNTFFSPDKNAICKTVIAKIITSSRPKQVRILLDSAATLCLIRKSLADELGLDGPSQRLAMSKTGGDTTEYKNMKIVSFQLESLDGTFLSTHIHACTIPQVTSYFSPITVTPSAFSHLSNVIFTEKFPQTQPFLPDILCGEPVYTYLSSNKGPIKGRSINEPAAWPTKLGFCLSGSSENANGFFSVKSHCTFSFVPKIPNEQFSLERFWNLEHIGILPCDDDCNFTLDEQEAIRIMKEVTFYNEKEKYYTTGLLWKNKEKIPDYDNKQKALAVLSRVTKTYQKKPELMQMYNETIQKFLDNDYIEPVPWNELNNKPRYYLEHFPVIDLSRDSTKLRVCLNSASKNSANVCFNDLLYSGPCLNNELVHILIKARIVTYFCITDVQQMFQKLRLPNDWTKDMCRLFWNWGQTPNILSSGENTLGTYRLKCHLFGFTCTPFQATYILKEHAKKYEKKFPKASYIIQNNSFVDDLSFGSNNFFELQLICRNIKTILDAADFKTHKWQASSSNLLKYIPTDLHANKEVAKVLGVQWKLSNDTFAMPFLDFKDNKKALEQTTFTMRQAVGLLSKLYDPVGYLSGFSISGRLLIQKCFLTSLKWDDCLPDDLLQKFLEWKDQLIHLKNLEIKRCIVPPGHKPKYLCSYGDASSHSYGLTIFCISSMKGDNNTEKLVSHLIFAKAKVKPLRQQLSIPRLELLASLIASRASNYCAKAFPEPIEQHLFTDSAITYHRIKHHHYGKFKIFLASRLKEIEGLIDKKFVHFSPTHLMPADICSKGSPLLDLLSNKLYWEGPSYLTQPNFDFDSFEQTLSNAQIQELESSENEIKILPQALATSIPFDSSILSYLLDRYENWSSCVRVLAWIQRFISSLKSGKLKKFREEKNRKPKRTRARKTPLKPKKQHPVPISVLEFSNAELTFIRFSQYQKFHEEILSAKSGTDLADTNCFQLKKFLAFYDHDSDLLRMNSRLRFAEIEFQDPSPIILPNHCKIVEKLIKSLHKSNVHCSIEQTLFILRRRFWLIGSRREVKRILHGCTCKKARILYQRQGALPKCRIEKPLPNTHVSSDLLGPMNVKVPISNPGKGKKKFSVSKCYICIFTCMQTRYIFLEVLENANAECFIDALRLLNAQVGHSRTVFMDCATYYKRASKELSNLMKQFDWEKVKNSVKQTEFIFNTPLASFRNGVTEIYCGITRRALKSAIGNAFLTLHELRIVIKEIQGMLNDRPLSAAGALSDPSECTGLSPNMLVLGRPSNLLPDEGHKFESSNLQSLWKRRNKCLNTFWSIFKRQYLLELSVSKVWQKKYPYELKEGMLVLLIDDRVSRGDWRRGIITKVIKSSSDGLVRTVEVRTPAGNLVERPVQKIAIPEYELPFEPPVSARSHSTTLSSIEKKYLLHEENLTYTFPSSYRYK